MWLRQAIFNGDKLSQVNVFGTLEKDERKKKVKEMVSAIGIGPLD